MLALTDSAAEEEKPAVPF